MKINFTAALILLGTATLFSCKKPNDGQSPNSNKKTELKAISGNTLFSNLPTVQDGILTFSSEAQFTDYIAYLDAMTNPQNYDSIPIGGNGDTLEFDQDAILEGIESDLGFTSARKIYHDKFLDLNKVGWDRPESIPEEHFIQDMRMRSVLNENLTVKVGDNYLHYINRNLSVKIDASKKDLLESFSRLPETATLADVLNIDRQHEFSRVLEVGTTGDYSIFGGGVGGGAHTLGSLSILNTSITSPDCNNTKKKVFNNMEMYESGSSYGDNGNSLQATFDIYFGDNTAHVTKHSATSGFHEIVPQFEHVYANPGTYTVHVVATSDFYPPGGGNGGITATMDYQVIVSETSCLNKYKTSDDEFHTVADGSRAWSGKISVEIGYIWFNQKMAMIFQTSSWLKDGNNWKQSKSEIWHSLHTERRNSNCDVLGQVDGDGWASSSKHIETHRMDDEYSWNKVTTVHGLNYHNSWNYFTKVLNVCD